MTPVRSQWGRYNLPRYTYIYIYIYVYIYIYAPFLKGYFECLGSRTKLLRLGHEAVHEDLQDIVDIKDQEHHRGIACA